MNYKEIGSTGIRISDICLGGMSFGKRSDDYYQWTLEEKETEISEDDPYNKEDEE